MSVKLTFKTATVVAVLAVLSVAGIVYAATQIQRDDVKGSFIVGQVKTAQETILLYRNCPPSTADLQELNFGTVDIDAFGFFVKPPAIKFCAANGGGVPFKLTLVATDVVVKRGSTVIKTGDGFLSLLMGRPLEKLRPTPKHAVVIKPGDPRLHLVAGLKLRETPEKLGVTTGDTVTFTALFKAEAVVVGTAGFALKFDGLDDLVQIPHSDSLSIHDAITVEAWVWRTGGVAWASKYDEGATNAGNAWDIHHDEFFISRTPTENNSLGYSSPAGRWVHISVVYDGSDQHVYINGVLNATRPWPGKISPSTSPVLIGSGHFGQYWGGFIDDLRIWNFARGQKQIQATKNTRLTGKEAGLVGYWTFDEGAGQTVGDTSGNGNVGRLGNSSGADSADPMWVESNAPLGPALTPITPPPGMVSWWPGDGHSNDIVGSNHGALTGDATFAPGMVGQAFSFDGVDDHVQVLNSPNLSPRNEITVEAWYRPVSFTGNGNNGIVDKAYPSHTDPFYQYHLGVSGNQYLDHPGSFQFYVTAGETLFPVGTGPNFWTPGNWYHIAGIYDGSHVKLFVNSVLIDSRPASGDMTDYGKNVLIGAMSGGSIPGIDFLPGDINEVAIYNRDLSDAEIKAIYNAGSAGKIKSKAVLTVSVDPKSAYLRTSTGDAPALPTIIGLDAVGFASGDLLTLTYEVPPPGFSFYGCVGPFVGATGASVLGVFSGSSNLLEKTVLARVPGAIDAGPDEVSGPTIFGTEPTDIPEDFRIFPPSGFTIVVPTGATHLFLGMHDSFFSDNCGTIKVTLHASG